MEFEDIEDEIGPAKADASGFLQGQFLVAMPGIGDDRFERAVIFIVNHSARGALGFVINHETEFSTGDILARAGIEDDSAHDIMTEDEPDEAALSVVKGGPVEDSRGFVLHTPDYASESTSRLADGLSLTTTLDVLRAVSRGRGPRRALLSLGYAGWGPGQLEDELRENVWLTVETEIDLVFDVPAAERYETALGRLGVAPGALSMTAGNA